VIAYPEDFYTDRHAYTIHAARTVLSMVLEALPPVRSAIDVGCGVGTWLSVLIERGVRDVLGIEGEWVEGAPLVIPRQALQLADLARSCPIGRRFDLAISLEVAEHLPEASAEAYLDGLVAAADFVLFSAAIPGQGGVGHVNEQWPAYWAEKFAARGYVALDCLRSRLWHDPAIPFWYRQNLLLIARAERMPPSLAWSVPATADGWPMALVHPDLYVASSGADQAPMA